MSQELYFQDIDEEMSANQISSYVESLVHEYEDLLWTRIEQMQKHDAKTTYRKIKKLKKNVLFTLLKINTKK